MTLVASVALAETIREAGVPAKIKWPNDVHLEGRKLAGILSELSAEGDRLDFIVLGLGVNLNASPSDFPTELAAQASSLFMARHRPVPRALFAAALFASLEHWIDVWTNDGFAPIRRAWRGLASTLGETVVVRGEAGTSEGFAEDIDDSGALGPSRSPVGAGALGRCGAVARPSGDRLRRRLRSGPLLRR